MNSKLKFNTWFKKKKRSIVCEAEVVPITIEQQRTYQGGMVNDPFNNSFETSFQPTENTSFGISLMPTQLGTNDFQRAFGYNDKQLPNAETLQVENWNNQSVGVQLSTHDGGTNIDNAPKSDFGVLNDEQKAKKIVKEILLPGEDVGSENSFASIHNSPEMEVRSKRNKRMGGMLRDVVITGRPRFDLHMNPQFSHAGMTLGQNRHPFYQMDLLLRQQIAQWQKERDAKLAAEAKQWKKLPTSLNVDAALNKIEQMVKTNGIKESPQTEPDHLRTADTPEALKTMDNGEFLNRYMKDIGLFKEVPTYQAHDYWLTSDFSKTFDNKLRKVGSGSFIPQVGDIYSQNIYNGIVKSYDKNTDMITFFRCKPGNFAHQAWKPGQVTIDTYKRSDISMDRNYYRPALTHVANANVVVNNSPTLTDAMVNMISCIDLSVSGAQAAAEVMKVNLPKFMGVAGKVSYLGPLDNVRQMITGGFNWNDASQAVIGSALIGFSASLGAPVVFVAGVGLFAWELGETYMELQKN